MHLLAGQGVAVPESSLQSHHKPSCRALNVHSPCRGALLQASGETPLLGSLLVREKAIPVLRGSRIVQLGLRALPDPGEALTLF